MNDYPLENVHKHIVPEAMQDLSLSHSDYVMKCEKCGVQESMYSVRERMESFPYFCIFLFSV